MADVPQVMDLPGVPGRVDALLREFSERQSDQGFLTQCLVSLDKVDEWKYSNGPVFDLPPYQMQLMGFGGGKLLKKQFASLEAARSAGAYASGFVAGQHRLTIDPAEKIKLSPQVFLYSREGRRTRQTITRQPSLAVPALPKPATLVGLAETIKEDDGSLLHVGVGTRGAFAVYLYCHDADDRPQRVHLFSKGHVAQSDYALHYGDDGRLAKVTDLQGSPVWPAR